jgi:SAM-dependent methyltransferase
VGAVLDLGCGAGTLALGLAPLASRVVGTDINPRAIVFARVNSALNARPVDWRAGDLLQPVAGETFDLIVAQPPFIPRYPGVDDATYLVGGERGDEIWLRALRDIPSHLAPGGRALLLTMAPTLDGETADARVRAAVADTALGVTVFAGPPFALDDWCTMYAARAHPDYGPQFDATAIAQRAHLDRLGVRGLALTATVLERPRHGHGWTTTVPVALMSRLERAHIDAKLGAQRLLAGPRAALFAAKLRPVAGATFAEDAAGYVNVRFPADSPWAPFGLNAATYALVSVLAQATDVKAAIGSVHGKTQVARETLIAAIEQALAHGIVEVD